MNHTPQIKKAIQFAARKHHGQLRVANKDEPLPYVTHLFSTALLVAEDGASDDVVTAALLHDAIEDTETTREEIIVAFNTQVADYVAEVSEDKSLPWKERKQKYLNQIENASEGALLIAIADKIDNIESKLDEIAAQGKEILASWSQPASEYAWANGEALRIAEARLPEHRLTKRLKEAHQKEVATLG